MGRKKEKEPASRLLKIQLRTDQTITESREFMDSARNSLVLFKKVRDLLANTDLDKDKIAYYDSAIKRLETQLDNHEAHINQLKDSINNEPEATILGDHTIHGTLV